MIIEEFECPSVYTFFLNIKTKKKKRKKEIKVKEKMKEIIL